MAGQDGEGLVTGGLEGTEAAQIVAVRSNAILSFDKAETIAARRLRELAIRLRNDDTQAGTDRVPFDADRHFRERLAERMATLGVETATTAPAEPVRYTVSDALSLSELGLSMPLLAGPAPRATAKIDVVQTDDAPADEMLLGVKRSGDPDAETQKSDVANDDDYPVFEPAVRLVDLINHQRTLVTRLADMSLAEDVEPEAGVDVTALGSGEFETVNAEAEDTVERFGLADSVIARSDAEELFEAATHTAEPIQQDDASDDALVPLAISAEQLIAALEAGPSSFKADEPAPGEKQLAELLINDRRSEEPRRHHAESDEEGADRAPMIIERARAEMAAIAASEAARPARQSGAVGFFAGLSLSIAVGIVLYYSL
jgi:hypothetical protein